MANPKRILFLSLGTFSQMGGIERFNRCFLKALDEIADVDVRAYSLYDRDANALYFPPERTFFFRRKKLPFILAVLQAAMKADIIIVGHINLSFLAVVLKYLKPSTRQLLITHGIDVWQHPHTGVKKRYLQLCDQILAVSRFTKEKLVRMQQTPADKISIFHNTIDPYLPIATNFTKPAELAARYGLQPEDKVIFALTRLSSSEQFKGYDKVLRTLQRMVRQDPGIKYILGGKSDERERARIQSLVASLGLEAHVVLPGFITEAEVGDHYLLADCYIMPSKKEGFGIVYIEALLYGLPVIAGNKDGSTDALQDGRLGRLIDPDSEEEIEAALRQALAGDRRNRPSIQADVIRCFGFPVFRERLSDMLKESTS